jgi:hypothetical protein
VDTLGLGMTVSWLSIELIQVNVPENLCDVHFGWRRENKGGGMN